MKVEILLRAFEHTQDNRRWLQDRAQNVLSWISGMLVAVIAFSAALGPDTLAKLDMYARVGLSLAIGALFIFAWISQIVTWRARVEELKSAAKIGRLLHFFEASYFDDSTIIFDEHDWTHLIDSRIRGWGVSEFTAVLFVLTVIAIVVLWSA